jgi:hypothetical protein
VSEIDIKGVQFGNLTYRQFPNHGFGCLGT